MSLSQFGYSSAYPAPGSPLASHSQQLLPPASSSTSSSPVMSNPCCENGRTFVHPHTGQTVCSCQYPPSLLTYSRVGVGLPEPVYPSTPYSAPQGYVPLGTDPSAFYSPLNSPYELKEAGETWRSIGQPPSCYPYDPAGMAPYPYPNAYGGVDINSAARRKNATRENTNTLKAWLYEHRKNPYPTKGEKIMLAIITKMTLTQVSTWFANARRRLKKENKMTWSPRNKPGDNDDDDDDDGNSKEKSDNVESDGDNDEGKTTRDETRNNEKDPSLPPDHPEQSSSSSSSTSHQLTRLYDTSPNSNHMSHGHMTSQSHSNTDHMMGRRPPPHTFASPQNMASPNTPPSFLSLSGPAPHSHSQVQGYNTPTVNGSSMVSTMGPMPPHLESGVPPSHHGQSPALKRQDSICSNGNDQMIRDVNCGYGDHPMDGLRPKIWSLAHVATSESGFLNHTTNTSMSSSNMNGGMMRNMGPHPPPPPTIRGLDGPSSHLGGLAGLPPLPAPPNMVTGPMTMNDGNNNNNNLSITSSASSPSTPSSPITPMSGGMCNQWGSMYGGPPVSGPQPCSVPGSMYPPPPGMNHGPPPMGSGPSSHTLTGLHTSPPSPSAYNHNNMASSNNYYHGHKMAME